MIDAGWSSSVARQAHNLKVVGSNPTPATNKFNDLAVFQRLLFWLGATLVLPIKRLTSKFNFY